MLGKDRSPRASEVTMQAEATVHEGAVVIPPAIREALRLRDGDTLIFDADDGRVHLRVRRRALFRDIVGIFGNECEGKTIEQILAAEREQRGD
jgi:AbrB family looped-hinge helix DNA binding protein